MRTRHYIPIIFVTIHASYQQQSKSFESLIKLSIFCTRFRPQNPIRLVANLSNVRSLLRCAMQCNQNRQCHTFDYDQSSLDCRLFEGNISTGTVLNNSIPSSSCVGSIRVSPPDALEQYPSYNQTCDQCGLVVNRYLQCISNTCQCPIHTYWDGRICSNQLYNGSSCNSSSACRQDFNLTCSDQTKTCRVGTLAGTVFLCYPINQGLCKQGEWEFRFLLGFTTSMLVRNDSTVYFWCVMSHLREFLHRPVAAVSFYLLLTDTKRCREFQISRNHLSKIEAKSWMSVGRAEGISTRSTCT